MLITSQLTVKEWHTYLNAPTLVDDYIRWYNEKRIKISLGSLSPIEYWESLGLTA